MTSRPAAIPQNRPGLVPIAIAAAALVVLTCIAYGPAFRAGFIWDDDDYVTQNLTLRSADGLRRIWLEPGAVPQYYPLTHTTFWIQHQLWGLEPAPYHAVNIILHAIAAILVMCVLLRLGLPPPVAIIASAVFALHPVHVESVAWVTERKNVLSAVMYLGAMLAYLRFGAFVGWVERSETHRVSPGDRRWRWYALAMALFILALLSKTVTATLPAALLVIVWWKRGAIRWRDVAPTLPMFALAIAAGSVTVWMEHKVVGARGDEWAYSLAERIVIAGRNLWFYAQKLVWPADLAFIYPRWDITPGRVDLILWVFPVAAAMVVAALWLLRGRLGRGPLAAVLYFVGTLFPALGFFNVYPFRFSFVADHFQYLASLGLITLTVSAGYRFSVGLGRHGRRIGAVVALVLLATLGTLTWRQSRIYHDLETLWVDTLAKNPRSYMPHYNLGNLLASQGRSREAMNHYYIALDLKPDLVQAMNNLGLQLWKEGRQAEAIALYHRAIDLEPGFPDPHHNLGVAYGRRGRLEDAVGHLQRAVELAPGLVEARVDLGSALNMQGKRQEAEECWREALRIDPENHRARVFLATALDSATTRPAEPPATGPGE